MFVLMSEPALKCALNAIFKQNYSLKLFILAVPADWEF